MKKRILFFLPAALIAGVSPVLADEPLTITADNNIVYTVDQSTMTCELTDGKKATNGVFIPQCINGYTVTSIASNAFQNNEWISSVCMPPEIKSMGDRVFYNCSNLSEVSLSKGITSLPVSTFENCVNLESVYVPDGIVSLEESAFKGCVKLEDIVLPFTLNKIGDNALADVGSELEYGCTMTLYSFSAPAMTSTSTEGAKFKTIRVTSEGWYDYHAAPSWSEYSEIFESMYEKSIEINSNYMSYTYGTGRLSVPFPFDIYEDGQLLSWSGEYNECFRYLKLTSSDPSCIHADYRLLYHGVQLIVEKEGTATITVDYKGVTRDFEINVVKTDIYINPADRVSLREGQTKTYEAMLSGFYPPYEPSDEWNTGGHPIGWNFEVEKTVGAEGDSPISIKHTGDSKVDVTGIREYNSDSHQLVVTAIYTNQYDSSSEFYFVEGCRIYPITVTPQPEPTGMLSLILPSGKIHFPDAGIRETRVKIEAEEGWAINTIMLGDTDITTLLDTKGYYTVPVLEQNTTLTAVFKENETSSVNPDDIIDENVKVYVSGSHITITGLEEGYEVNLFDLSGRCVHTTFDYDFEVSGKGVRILRVGHHTFKLIVN